MPVLRNLAELHLHNLQLTEAALETLCGLTQLRRLNLIRVELSNAWKTKLRSSLPDCEISGID